MQPFELVEQERQSVLALASMSLAVLALGLDLLQSRMLVGPESMQNMVLMLADTTTVGLPLVLWGLGPLS